MKRLHDLQKLKVQKVHSQVKLRQLLLMLAICLPSQVFLNKPRECPFYHHLLKDSLHFRASALQPAPANDGRDAIHSHDGAHGSPGSPDCPQAVENPDQHGAVAPWNR